MFNSLKLIPNSPYSLSATRAPYSVWRDNFVYICILCILAIFGHWKGEETWLAIHSSFSQRTIVYLFTFFISTFTFWTMVGFISILDIYQLATTRKLQPYQRFQERQEFLKAFRQTIFNQFVVGIPAGFFFLWTWQVLGSGDAGLKLPSYSTLLWNVFVLCFCVEIGFYYTHRLLHWPKIYRHFHKRHHEFKSPMAICSIYVHPVEHLLANLFPVFLGPIVARSHIVVIWIWLVVVSVNTINSHCGYTIPGFPNPLHHDFHHVKFTNNFGIFGLLDEFHGTNVAYKQLVAQIRNEKDS